MRARLDLEKAIFTVPSQEFAGPKQNNKIRPYKMNKIFQQ